MPVVGERRGSAVHVDRSRRMVGASASASRTRRADVDAGRAHDRHRAKRRITFTVAVLEAAPTVAVTVVIPPSA